MKKLTEGMSLEAGDCSDMFEGAIQLADEPEDDVGCKRCSDLQNPVLLKDVLDLINLSNMPQVADLLGPYEEIDEETIKHLQTDFRIYPHLLYHVPKLFRGAIIHDKQTLLAITNETYPREASIDIHLETDMVSLPSSKSYYKGLTCLIAKSSDNRSLMNKLIIGSRSVNLLITCSLTISPSNSHQTFVGPQVELNQNVITPDKARIFLRSEEISTFKKAFLSLSEVDNSNPFTSVSSIGQLASAFDNESKYTPLRATLEDFDDTRFEPFTVFTLCDSPDQEAYGCNSGSAPKLGSLLLQLVAIHVNTQRKVSNKSLIRFYNV